MLGIFIVYTLNSKFEKPENEMDELRKRIIQLEILLKKNRFVEGMG